MAAYCVSFLVIAFAFLYRARGGFNTLGGGTQAARLVFWVLPITLWAATVDYRMAILCGIGSFLGLMMPHGWAFGDTKPLHVLGMAAIGLARLSLILAPLAWFNHSLVWFFPIGLLHGLVYYFGNKWLFKYDIPLKWNEAKFTDGGTSWGEILTGAVFGAVFACVYLTA